MCEVQESLGALHARACCAAEEQDKHGRQHIVSKELRVKHFVVA